MPSASIRVAVSPLIPARRPDDRLPSFMTAVTLWPSIASQAAEGTAGLRACLFLAAPDLAAAVGLSAPQVTGGQEREKPTTDARKADRLGMRELFNITGSNVNVVKSEPVGVRPVDERAPGRARESVASRWEATPGSWPG